MIDSSVLGGPYVFAAATLASAKPPAPYVFRNYELPLEAAPLAAAIRACPGSSRHDVWQAVRASSAAPYCERRRFMCTSVCRAGSSPPPARHHEPAEPAACSASGN
jgi:hypothetical protein